MQAIHLQSPKANRRYWLLFKGLMRSQSARRRRKEIHRELFFETFPTIGVEPHLADRLGTELRHSPVTAVTAEKVVRPEATVPGIHYLWRTSHHDEFNLELQPGEARYGAVKGREGALFVYGKLRSEIC